MMKGGGRDRELGKRTVKSQTLDHVYGFDIKKVKVDHTQLLSVGFRS